MKIPIPKVFHPFNGDFYYVTTSFVNMRTMSPGYYTMLVQSLGKTDPDSIACFSLARILEVDNYRAAGPTRNIGSVVSNLEFHHLGFTRLKPDPTFYCYKCKKETTPDMLGLCPNCVSPFNFLQHHRSRQHRHRIPEEVIRDHITLMDKFNHEDANASDDWWANGVELEVVNAIRSGIRNRVFGRVTVSRPRRFSARPQPLGYSYQQMAETMIGVAETMIGVDEHNDDGEIQRASERAERLLRMWAESDERLYRDFVVRNNN